MSRVFWTIYRGVKIPVVRTRKHKEWARQISYDIFIRGVRNRAGLSIPATKEAESFATYYIHRLQAEGLLEMTEEGFSPTLTVERELKFNKMLWELREHMSVRELAEKLDVPIPTVRAWLYYSSTPRALEVYDRVKELYRYQKVRIGMRG